MHSYNRMSEGEHGKAVYLCIFFGTVFFSSSTMTTTTTKRVSFVFTFPHSLTHTRSHGRQLFNLLHIRHRIHTFFLPLFHSRRSPLCSSRSSLCSLDASFLFDFFLYFFFVLIVVDAFYSSSLEKRVKKAIRMCVCLCVGWSFSLVCIYRVQCLLNVQRENDAIRSKVSKTKALPSTKGAHSIRICMPKSNVIFLLFTRAPTNARFYESNCISSPLLIIWFAIWWCMLQCIWSSNFIATSAFSVELHQLMNHCFSACYTLCRETMQFLRT